MDGDAGDTGGQATTRRRGGRWSRRGAAVGLTLIALSGGVAACSDDETIPAVSDERYTEAVVELCERHMPALQEAWDDLRAAPFSDAELAAFYRSDLVPRVRSILRSARNGGLPNDQAVHDGINEGANALQDIEDDAAGLIDRRRDGTFLEGEDPLINLNEALRSARIDCAVEENAWEP